MQQKKRRNMDKDIKYQKKKKQSITKPQGRPQGRLRPPRQPGLKHVETQAAP